MRRRSHSSGSASYSGVILKRASFNQDEFNQQNLSPREELSSKNPWQTFKVRSLYGTLMILGLYLIFLIGPLAIISLIAAVQTLVFKEVISIAHARSLEKKLPWFRTITWYFLCCTNYYLYGESFAQNFKHLIYADAFLLNIVNHHQFISFCLYLIGMILFVINLKKGHYKFQFGQLAFTHMALLLIVFQSHFLIRTVFDGLIWFILPVSLVTCNDIMAYIFGIVLGRTPLIKVSPRKTWEGFLGGFLSTVLFGFLFSGYLAKFPSLTCPISNLFISPFQSEFTCKTNVLFVKQKYVLTPFFSDLLRLFIGKRVKILSLYPVQLHSLVLACFSSSVAPFGGFFASGFKRAFKLKDFSDSIPGHGGVADRVDCQIVNGLFTYLYLTSFIKRSNGTTVGTILESIVNGLSSEEQRILFFKLQDFLIGQGILSDVVQT